MGQDILHHFLSVATCINKRQIVRLNCFAIQSERLIFQIKISYAIFHQKYYAHLIIINNTKYGLNVLDFFMSVDIFLKYFCTTSVIPHSHITKKSSFHIHQSRALK